MGTPALLAAYAPVVAAATSALVAAAVAWVTARRSVRAQLDLLKLGVQQKLLEQLVAARLVSYPELYSMISDLVKAMYGRNITAVYLRALQERIHAWDSLHAILLGPHTTNVCFDFRQTLALAARLADQTGEESAEATNAREDLWGKAARLELGLRSDLGVYGVELAQAPDALHTPRVERYE